MRLDKVRGALRSLIPPPKLRLSEWIERTVRLPPGVSALPGPVRLWPYQVGIADAISDPAIERITLIKPVRVGFTTLLTAAIGSYVVNDPSPIHCLLPTESDCRDYVVSDIEPIFAATPVLRGALTDDRSLGEDRNTLLSRRFPGGGLKVVSARAPRNLRRHTARILIVDEADAAETGAEGNPIRLAERRTLSFANRKIIVGSTPLFEDTSHVLRAYAESDARVFEVPCPECGAFTEILWPHIQWELEQPSTARFQCPHCKALVDERHKAGMVNLGRWRATREAAGHAGFRLNALISLLANASWGRLAAEFRMARGDPAELQTFVNTILAQGWAKGGEEVDEHALQARAEPFGLDSIPREVIVVTAGADLQDDRIEIAVCGWTREGDCLVLAHFVIWGSPDDDTLWFEVDELLKTRWPHPHGGQIGIHTLAVDSGDGEWTARVYDYCFPRANRHVLAVKGMGGSRPEIEASKGKIGAHGDRRGRLWIAGVDVIKTTLFDRLQRGQRIRFSHTLPAVFYEQLASERRVVRYRRGQPVRRFERVSGRARAEALDAVVYCFAAHKAVTTPLDRLEARLSGVDVPRRSIASMMPRWG